MRKIVLLWMGVLLCSAMVSAAIYDIGPGEYWYGDTELTSEDNLTVSGGGQK